MEEDVRWIQRFEYTFELVWKVMQDYLRYLGFDFQPGPNSTLKLALEVGMIEDQAGWKILAADRITTAHTYDEEDALNVVNNIFCIYSSLFTNLQAYLSARIDNQ